MMMMMMIMMMMMMVLMLMMLLKSLCLMSSVFDVDDTGTDIQDEFYSEDASTDPTPP